MKAEKYFNDYVVNYPIIKKHEFELHNLYKQQINGYNDNANYVQMTLYSLPVFHETSS
jgi:hypothetical protein